MRRIRSGERERVMEAAGDCHFDADITTAIGFSRIFHALGARAVPSSTSRLEAGGIEKTKGAGTGRLS